MPESLHLINNLKATLSKGDSNTAVFLLNVAEFLR